MPIKIGARYFKTALAVMICVFFGTLFNRSNSFFSAITAVISMQDTFSASLIYGRNRIFGTFIGALLGLGFTLILPGNTLLIGIGVIIVICICTTLKWDGAIIIATILFLAIMINADRNVYEYSTFRLLDTFSGVVIALAVNYFVFPHKPLQEVYKRCSKLIKDFPETIDQVLYSNEKVDLTNLHDDIIELEEKSRIKNFDLTAHKEDWEDLNQIAHIIENLFTLYEHLNFVEKLQTGHNFLSDSDSLQDGEEEERKKQDIILDFHRQQLLEGWSQVKDLWDKKEVSI